MMRLSASDVMDQNLPATAVGHPLDVTACVSITTGITEHFWLVPAGGRRGGGLSCSSVPDLDWSQRLLILTIHVHHKFL